KRFEHTSMEKTYRILECAYGSFQRTVALPVAVDIDRAEATYRDGVLRLELPKVDGSKARRIDVRNGN
ncbi:MAG: Hsp20/alpha crystallin family protein, partial [Burkholderiales bacterium]|nr:Hsp20/alpha crystallin family protein [Burkholderiales bacterium]